MWRNNNLELTTIPEAIFEIEELERLDLSYNKIGDKGVNCLITRDFRNLERLNLVHNLIENAGINSLVTSSICKLLKTLLISENFFDNQAVELLEDNEMIKGLDYKDI